MRENPSHPLAFCSTVEPPFLPINYWWVLRGTGMKGFLEWVMGSLTILVLSIASQIPKSSTPNKSLAASERKVVAYIFRALIAALLVL